MVRWTLSIIFVTAMQDLQHFTLCNKMFKVLVYLNSMNMTQLTDSNMAPDSPILPLGVTPSPPIRPAHKSLKINKINLF